MAKWLTFSCAAPAMVIGALAHAYEPSTHNILSQRAASDSRIVGDPSLMLDLGLGSAAMATFDATDLAGNAVAVSSMSAPAIIGYGAVLEDFYEENCEDSHGSTLGWMRVFNHFLDPQHDTSPGQGGLSYAGIVRGHPSADWALEDRGDVTTRAALCTAPGRAQTFSYRNGQEYLLNSLVAADPTQRRRSASLAFQSLGHVIHHLQDMAQPQHTRNDRHNTKARAWYEVYTEKHVNARIPDILANSPAYPIPLFATARSYWYTVGAGSPTYVGMAEFSSQNYVTYGTKFRSGTASGGNEVILPHPDYPLPNGTNADGTQKAIVTLPQYRVVNMDGSVYQGPLNVVVGDVFDGYAYGHRTGKILATTSLLDRHLSEAGRSRVFAVNGAVFEDNYAILLPRAVSFSAGIINHFFAGRIGLRRASSGSGWVVDNFGTESMTGTVSLYYENAAQQRAIVPNGVWGGSLASGQSTPALPEPPSGTARLIAVFSGTIGSETSLNRVAGKVIDYATPPVDCAGSRNDSGGSAGLEYVRELGSSAGQVQLEFEAYGIPDAVTMWSENSVRTRLVRSDGQVSGFHQYTYNFDPAALGSTKVRVRVDGNADTGTMWVTTLGCPGQNLGNGQRGDYLRATVRFSFGQPLSGAMGTCDADFYVDGVRIGGVHVGASGGSSLSSTLTKGPAHYAEFRNFRCSSDNRNILVGASYVDPAGHTHAIQNWNVSGSRTFDIH